MKKKINISSDKIYILMLSLLFCLVSIFLCGLKNGLIVIGFSLIIAYSLFAIVIKKNIEKINKIYQADSLIHKMRIYALSYNFDEIPFDEILESLSKKELEVISSQSDAKKRLELLKEYYCYQPFNLLVELLLSESKTEKMENNYKFVDTYSKITSKRYDKKAIREALLSLCIEIVGDLLFVFALKVCFKNVYNSIVENRIIQYLLVLHLVLMVVIVAIYIYRVLIRKKDYQYQLYKYISSSLALMGYKTPYLALEDALKDEEYNEKLRVDSIVVAYQNCKVNEMMDYAKEFNYPCIEEALAYISSLNKKNAIKNNDYIYIEWLLEDILKIDTVNYKQIRNQSEILIFLNFGFLIAVAIYCYLMK